VILPDGTKVNAGLAWAVPVRPDLLGQAVEAYSKLLPRITALRLCHRYVQGPHAHITRLPVELLSAIEDLMYEAIRTRITTWIDTFRHFESRCEPADHLSESEHEEIWDMARWRVLEESGFDCYNSDGEPDEEQLEDAIEEEFDRIIMSEGWEDCYESCELERAKWEGLIAKTPNGNFEQYSRMLRKCFGVEAYFATTRPTSSKPKRWPANCTSLPYGDE
jgi:hypothetical protein